jgi:hypothetical protein
MFSTSVLIRLDHHNVDLCATSFMGLSALASATNWQFVMQRHRIDKLLSPLSAQALTAVEFGLLPFGE